MLKNGYLKESDIKGKKYYQVASGEIQAGTTITIHEIKIGDAVLQNVEASVVHSQTALFFSVNPRLKDLEPLLLTTTATS